MYLGQSSIFSSPGQRPPIHHGRSALREQEFAMIGALEFQEVSARILRMTDAELVDMADHPQDYEEWALRLGQEELARRGLAPEHVDALRTDNAAEARASAK